MKGIVSNNVERSVRCVRQGKHKRLRRVSLSNDIVTFRTVSNTFQGFISLCLLESDSGQSPKYLPLISMVSNMGGSIRWKSWRMLLIQATLSLRKLGR